MNTVVEMIQDIIIGTRSIIAGAAGPRLDGRRCFETLGGGCRPVAAQQVAGVLAGAT